MSIHRWLPWSRRDFRALGPLLICLTALTAGACSLATPLPEPTTVEERLASLPLDGAPVSRPVTIYWNEHKVPFVEAATDEDLAVGLGMVHAHLRLGQLELMRRVSQGRLAELGGPFTVGLDTALRTIDYGKVSEQVVAEMAPADRRWVESFVAGLNHYQDHGDLPHEFALLGIDPTPWRPEEIVTIGRLASTDVNWFNWFQLIAARARPDWPEIWQTHLRRGRDSATSFDTGGNDGLETFGRMIIDYTKSGSNSIAIAGSRTLSGSAMMASDPHLGLSLPNIWLIAGIKSPSYHAVGLMIPGLPFLALGRNHDIAWGGTNLRPQASDLFELGPEELAQAEIRRETIGVRLWPDQEVEFTETPWGTVINDIPILEDRPQETLALKWIGHRPSDEVSAMLALNRATNWDEFREAMARFALSPQNMLFADSTGNIGQVTAVHLPRRSTGEPQDLVLPPSALAAWDSFATSDDLPQALNPTSGFLASANNRPPESDVPIGWFFASDDRIDRLRDLLTGNGPVDVARLIDIQRDSFRASALRLRDAILEAAERVDLTDEIDTGSLRALWDLRAWDGYYLTEAVGPLVLETLAVNLSETLYDPDRFELLTLVGEPHDQITEDLPTFEVARLRPALIAAFAAARDKVAGAGNWGGVHRTQLAHVLGRAPLIGGRYVFGDIPALGGNSTIHKTAHPFTDDRHFTRYGSNARHISDMADPDANLFALFGGQDGWFNSVSFLDQVAMWQESRYIRVPLTLEKVRAEFPYRTVVRRQAVGG